MEHIAAIAAINAQGAAATAHATAGTPPAAAAPRSAEVTQMVERFGAMMQRAGSGTQASPTDKSPSALTRIVGDAADAELGRTAALDQVGAQPMSKLETLQHVAQMSVQGSFMALRMQAFAQISNRTREGVQTLVKNH